MRKRIKIFSFIIGLVTVFTNITIILIFFATTAYAQSITEFIVPTADSLPNKITTGPDGNLWFTEDYGNKIARITPQGNITEFAIPTVSNPKGITKGSDGNLWFIEQGIIPKIARITPQGNVTEFIIPTPHSFPDGIAAGDDGNLWFMEINANKIGRITPQGIFTEFAIPTPNSYSVNITNGPDGNLWFAEYTAAKIGKITTDGIITEFSISSWPMGITSGPDGNIWYTVPDSNKIGKMTLQGNITEYSLTTYGYPWGITSGPDGNLWFTDPANNIVGRITPQGIITEFFTSSPPYNITSGPDGNIWFTESTDNKIGRINLVATSLLGDFKQTDPQWSTASNLPANASTRLNHLLSCGDMYSFGCAVTSVADVFYSYGKTTLSNTPLTPGSLNNWLTTHNGFSACSIIWANASSATQLGAPTIQFRNNSATWSAGQQAIDNAISAGNLPIIGVYTSFGTHFFVVSEKLPDVNGKPNYKIVDPALYPFTANNPGKTGQSLSQAYGGWDKVFETVIYKKGTNPQKTLTIRAHSPVQLFITDPFGNTTGFDESTQEIMENIPDSSYGIEGGIAPVDGSEPAMEETKYFQQIDPTEGEYEVQLIGTGNGEYSLDFSKTDEEGNVSTEVVNGFAQTGVTEVYQIEYTPNATNPVVVEKQITFDTLKSDLKALYTQGKIKNKGIYSLLKLQVEIAKKASLMNKQPLGTKLAILALKTVKFELNRQRGKQITEDAYQILYNDVQSLINQLQGNSEEPPEDPGGGS